MPYHKHLLKNETNKNEATRVHICTTIKPLVNIIDYYITVATVAHFVIIVSLGD